MSISDQLRNAIAESGTSANLLAKACGMSQPTVSRLVRGEDVKLSIADKLAEHLGLELRPAKPKTKPAKRK